MAVIEDDNNAAIGGGNIINKIKTSRWKTGHFNVYEDRHLRQMESSIPLTRPLDQPDDDSYSGLVDKAAQTNRQDRSDALGILIENRKRRLIVVYTAIILFGTLVLTWLLLLANFVNDKNKPTTSNQKTYAQYNCSDQGWIGYRDNCYNVSTGVLTWYDAAAFCRRNGSHLAIVYSSEDITFLQTLARENLRNSTGMWLDGTDFLKEGLWIWNTTGDVITYDGWHKTQPNNWQGSQQCLEIAADGGFGFDWNDDHCMRQNQFICQKKNENFNSTNY